MRLEPTFRLLEVPFNINLVTTWLLCHYCGVYVLYIQARDVMNERPGAAMRLLYQLFVALNRMKASTHWTCGESCFGGT